VRYGAVSEIETVRTRCENEVVTGPKERSWYLDVKHWLVQILVRIFRWLRFGRQVSTAISP